MFKIKERVAIWENELFISRERIYNKREQNYILRKWISQFNFIPLEGFWGGPYEFTNIHILNEQMQCMYR